MNALPTFTCRCGAVVPLINMWIVRQGDWESVFCSQSCIARAMPLKPRTTSARKDDDAGA